MKRISIVAGIFSLLLQACVAPQPTISRQAYIERATSTLNEYEDNRVAFEAQPTSGPGLWAWSTDRTRILGLSVGGHIYNAKDISSISVSDTSDQTYRNIKVQLKSGESVELNFQFHSSAVAWVSCTPQKTCVQKVPDNSWGASSDPNVSHLGDLLTGIFQVDFSTRPAHTLKDVLINPSPDLYSESKIRFLSQQEMDALQLRLAQQDRAWQQVQDNNARNRDALLAKKAARRRELDSEAAEMRRHIHVGTMTNCGEVFDVRLPMIGVQTIKGAQFIDVSLLYTPANDCLFVNGVYAGPGA